MFLLVEVLLKLLRLLRLHNLICRNQKQAKGDLKALKCRKGAIFDAGVSSVLGEVINTATVATRPVGHPKKSSTPEFQRI